MFTRVIFFKFLKGYKYLSIGLVADKICAPIILMMFSVNMIGIIQGNVNGSFSMLIIGIIGYLSFSRVLCFEDEKTVLVYGKLLSKSETHISSEVKDNLLALKNGKYVVSIWVSAKGKEKLYNRFGN